MSRELPVYVVNRIPCFQHVDKVNKIRQIKGRKWNPKNKYWSIPENEETIRQFKDLFSNEEVNYTEIINDMRPLNKLSNENRELISQF